MLLYRPERQVLFIPVGSGLSRPVEPRPTLGGHPGNQHGLSLVQEYNPWSREKRQYERQFAHMALVGSTAK